MKKRILGTFLALLMIFPFVAVLADEPAKGTERSNVDIIYDFLTGDMKLNSAAACGILANIEMESGFNPEALGDNGTSYGICQWHDIAEGSGRWTKLREFCVKNGYDPSKLMSQLYYLKYELQNFYPKVWNYVYSAENSEQGAYDVGYYWCYNFEIPDKREERSVARGNSEFCGKLGQKIASDIVTAIDDGTLPGEWGSIRYDDEGNPSQCNVLIQNGMLKSYLVDRLGSRIMNQPMTGSARRQSYEFAPTSRMTNTFFAPGYDDEEEMIRTMGEGLFAAKMGGGSVNPLTGEFNFSVLEGYWVKDGKIHCPVRGAALIGRGAEVLMKIDRVGMNMWFGHGMCGSRSGSVPTNVGQPRIRVSGITVGGKGGRL